MNDPIAILKQDHREVAAMLKTLAAGRPGARRQATVDKLVGALGLHMQIEEDDIYPLVAKLVDREDAEEGGIEHQLMRDGISRVEQLVAAPGFGAAVAMLTAGIKHHVREEEHDMFPALKRKLDRESLRALGDEVAAAKKGSRAARKG